MNDSRRIKVPWYAWRWRLGLLLPMALFVFLTVDSLREFTANPLLSILFGAGAFAIALLFARQAWRERYPLGTEVRRPPGEAG